MNRKRKNWNGPPPLQVLRRVLSFSCSPFALWKRSPYNTPIHSGPAGNFRFRRRKGFTHDRRKGKKVRVHYTGTLADGDIFDSSTGRDPLEFVVGAGQMIAGFDRGVEGMAVGEEKTLTLPPDQCLRRAQR